MALASCLEWDSWDLLCPPASLSFLRFSFLSIRANFLDEELSPFSLPFTLSFMSSAEDAEVLATATAGVGGAGGRRIFNFSPTVGGDGLGVSGDGVLTGVRVLSRIRSMVVSLGGLIDTDF